MDEKSASGHVIARSGASWIFHGDLNQAFIFVNEITNTLLLGQIERGSQHDMMRIVAAMLQRHILPDSMPDKLKEVIAMTKKTYPSNVLAQAQSVLVGWGQVSATLTFGTLNPGALTADITSASTFESEISKLEIQLADKRNQRDLAYNAMWDKIKRVRAGVKANYGDDSQQFEMVGGTRTSERKSPTRRVVTE
jgi:hypothetical protein